jgi:histidinol-phosphate aminotransferase
VSPPLTPSSRSPTARPIADQPPGPAGGLADASEGLALIKPAVRGHAGYVLSSPPAARKLNQNESPYDLPAALKAAVLAEVAAAEWQRYPEFAPAALLERLAAHFGWRADGVLVGNGSNELIQATLAVTLGFGDVVVAPSPTFSLYRLLTNVLGGRYHGVPSGPRLEIDVDALIEVAVKEGARLVIVNSPNNPTGAALAEGAVGRLLEETGALIVCDEAYQEFGGPTALPLLHTTSRLVVLRTFSKAMGMAGLRFGLALMHPAVARELAKGKLPYNVNLVTLAAAGAILRNPAERMARTSEIVETRDAFTRRLKAVPGLTAYPSAANFVLVRFDRMPASEVFRRLLDEDGILVRDVSSTAELTECLRISIGTPDDMDATAAALERILG